VVGTVTSYDLYDIMFINLNTVSKISVPILCHSSSVPPVLIF